MSVVSFFDSRQVFVNTFRDIMLKSGFIIKNNSFFKVDFQNKWVKSVFISLWGQNRLYRICIELIPFTTLFDLGQIKERVYYDINHLTQDCSMDLIPATQETSLDAFYPSLGNMERSLDIYKTHILTEFDYATTFCDCIRYLTQLKQRRHIEEFEEYDMIYAYLYLNDIEEAYNFACRFKKKLCDQEKRIAELRVKYTESSSGLMQNDIVNTLSDQLNGTKEKLSHIDSILSSLQNHQLDLLIRETNSRIDTAINSCYRFFTKREQNDLGIRKTGGGLHGNK